MNSVKVSINGKTFTLSTDDNPEKVKNLAQELNSKITEFMKSSSVTCQDATSLVAFMLMDDLDSATIANEKLKAELSAQKKAFMELESQLNTKHSEALTHLNAQYSQQMATLRANHEEELRVLRQEFSNLSMSPEEVRALREKTARLEEKARLELLETVSLEYDN